MKDPKRVAAGKRAWAKMSMSKKAAAKARLRKFAFKKGGGRKSYPAKGSSKNTGGGSTAKRKRVDPVPIIGVPNSKAISVPRATAAAVVGGALLIPSAGRTHAAVSQPFIRENVGQGIQQGTAEVMERLREIKLEHGATIAAIAVVAFLFGKAIDRRLRGFPVKLGR